MKFHKHSTSKSICLDFSCMPRSGVGPELAQVVIVNFRFNFTPTNGEVRLEGDKKSTSDVSINETHTISGFWLASTTQGHSVAQDLLLAIVKLNLLYTKVSRLEVDTRDVAASSIHFMRTSKQLVQPPLAARRRHHITAVCPSKSSEKQLYRWNLSYGLDVSWSHAVRNSRESCYHNNKLLLQTDWSIIWPRL